MGNTMSSAKKDTLMTEQCFTARRKIQDSRETFLERVRQECEDCSDDIKLSEEVHQRHEEDEKYKHIDSTQYEFPFENLILEGGGAKGLAYCGVGKALEEHGLMKQIHRFAGTSIGAITATLYAVGFNSFDVEKVMSVNMETLVNDASYGYLSFIPNLLSHYGWHPGNRFLNFLGAALGAKTNDPDITFAELYKKFGNELCIVVTNVNTMTEEYCHVKTTPDMPIRIAVRMSMSIPGVFYAMKHKLYSNVNLYVDGGVICNYPIHCYDGWWLSMNPQDSFLQRIQPINDIHTLLDKQNRFKICPGPPRSLGCVIYSAEENEYFLAELKKKSGVSRGDLPNTKLARKWAKTEEGNGKLNIVYTEVCEAATEFMKVLRKHNLDGNDTISREEFEKAFSEENFRNEYSGLLFGEGCDPYLAFEAVDRDGSGHVTYNELINYIEETGVCIHEKYLGFKRKEVDGFFNFLGRIFVALGTNVMRIFLRSSDVNRTVGINTWYITTQDFGMEDGDKEFIKDQGHRSTVRYLQNYVIDNNLEKLPEEVIKSREVPTKTSLSDEQLAEILKI